MFAIKFTVGLPEELIDLFGIDEDTGFETYFENGKIHIRVLEEGEFDNE